MSGWDQKSDIEDLEHMAQQNVMWGMHCFNGLSAAQQKQVVEQGYLEFGSKPEGECPRPAQIEVTTIWDKFPGPRFYCRGCAIKYLMEVK